MAKKTKTLSQKLTKCAGQAGMMLMATAATVGLLEMPDHDRNKIIVPNQPSFALAGESANDQGSNPLRREREETAPHFISYSEVQRTPGRTKGI